MDCVADTTSAELANKLMSLFVEFALEGEAVCKIGNGTSHCVKVYTAWTFLRKYINMFVFTLHTLKLQAGAAEEGGDHVFVFASDLAR